MIRHSYKINKRNPYYLKFLSAICTLNQQGVSVNQEILFKIFSNKDFSEIHDAAFVKIEM